MSPSVKRPLIYSLFFIFTLAALNGADVKLRIYLKDGNLQSGNLVQKTENSFVILGKEGRQEIPFNDIMFINGKTLQEWEKKPDQLFQTEIIPSELPEVGYVNDKAALPKPPPLPTPVELPKPEPVKEKPKLKKMPPPPEEKVVETPPTEPEPVVEKRAPAPEPVQEVKKEKPAPAKKEVVKKSAPSKPKKEIVEAKKPARQNRNFNRNRLGEVHYQNAKTFLKQNEQGAAVSELHFATMLDRRNADAAFMLGKIYFEKGVFGRAKKLFEHPGLKKNDEAARLSAMADDIEASQAKERNVFLAATAGGLFLIVPGVWALRRFRKPAVKKKVFDAESLTKTPEMEKPVQAEKPVPPQIADLIKDIPSEEPPVQLEEKPAAPPPPAPPVPPAKWPAFKAPQPPTPQKPLVPPLPPKPPAVPPPPPLSKPAPPPPKPVQPPAPPQPQRVFEVVSAGPTPPVEPSNRTPEEEREIRMKNQARVSETLQMAHVSAGEREWSEAEKKYRTVLLLDPANCEAVLGLGFVYFGQESLAASRNFYLQALKLEPENVEGLYGLGQLELTEGREEEAVDLFQRVLNLDPGFREAEETLLALGRLPGAAPKNSDLDRKIS